jgi:hypothetical protein
MENGGVVACVVVFFILTLLLCVGTGLSNYRTYNQCKRTARYRQPEQRMRLRKDCKNAVQGLMNNTRNWNGGFPEDYYCIYPDKNINTYKKCNDSYQKLAETRPESAVAALWYNNKCLHAVGAKTSEIEEFKRLNATNAIKKCTGCCPTDNINNLLKHTSGYVKRYDWCQNDRGARRTEDDCTVKQVYQDCKWVP